MKAKEMFEEIGFNIKEKADYVIIYQLDTKNYDVDWNCYVVFYNDEFELNKYWFAFTIDKKEDIFIYNPKLPTPQINEKAVGFKITIKHHQAIHQQMKELGWIE